MDTLRTFMIGALVGAPLLAWGLSWLEGQLSRQVLLNVARGAVIVALLSGCGLSFAARSPDSSPVEFAIMSWLRMPGFGVTLGVRFDGFAFVQTTLVSVVLLLVLSAWPAEVALRWLMLAWFGVTLAIMAGNLGQMFVGWTLSAWASSELARKPGNNLRPVWLVQRVSDFALLAGIGIVWMHFNSSLEFAAWTPAAIGALRPELIESIALCVLIGVIGRCAQLPLTIWLETEVGFAAQTGNSMMKLSDVMVGVWNVPDGHQVAKRLKSDPANRWHSADEDSVSPPVLAWWLCAAYLPVGLGLLFRFEPFFVVASHTRLLMVAVGAFTLLMCSMNAASQNTWSQVLGQLTVGQCGLVFVALGLEHRHGQASALLLFWWQSVILTVLLVANSEFRRSQFSGQRRSAVLLIAVLCLASGLWGRQAVSNLVWEQAWPAESVAGSAETASLVFGATASRLWRIVVGLVCVSELLVSFSVLRAWFHDRRQQSQQDSERLDSPPWGLWLTVTAMSLGGLWIGNEGKFTGPPNLFQLGNLLPLSAAGMVLAWWMYSKPSSLPEKFSAVMGPFARLSRNRFYWDDLYFLLIVHPAKVSGEWLRWFDERVLGNGVRTLRSRLLHSLGESAEPLVAGSAMIGALTTLSSVAVLAWMLLWLRS